MENISQFDLNIALRRWLERLGQSPQVKAENLKELESHVRDSVVQLQTKGLSSEESFLLATHRVGSAEKLEPEFAKVNRSPWNLILHGLVLLFFSVCCWFLWAISTFPQMMAQALQALQVKSGLQGLHLPGLSQLVMNCGSYLAVPPVLAAVYCAYVWKRKSLRGRSWIGFFAVTMAILILLALPILAGVFVALIGFLNSLPASLFKLN